jgi:ribosome-associated protein
MRSPREGAEHGTPPTGFASFRADPNRLLKIVLDTLDGSKAEDVVAIDLKGKTSIGDHMVLASGRSQRHVGAVADHLIKKLKDEGYGRARVEGLPQCDWVLIDAGDVIVHVFRPEVRDFYNLEKMWSADRPMERMVV